MTTKKVVAKKKASTVVTQQTVLALPTTPIPVPFRRINVRHSISLGLRTPFLESPEGDITSGAGLGSPWITLTWKGRKAAVHALDLLAVWVETFNPEDAKDIREANLVGDIGVSVQSRSLDECARCRHPEIDHLDGEVCCGAGKNADCYCEEFRP